MSSVNKIRDTKGIAKNTIFLYIRSIVVMAVGIYTSRVVLQALGVDDYGVYNVIGGFVAMFSILSASLVNASQRFISFEMGKQKPQMNRIFCGTMSIHILLALIVFVAFETFGIWFLNTQLNIDHERMTAANWVFQCSVLTFCINLISVPFNASIIAHERMNIFAYISIYEAFAKLGIVYLLWISGYDKLILYALLMLAVSISLQIVYWSYCKRHFQECRFHFVVDKPLFKNMLGFTGWNFIGSTVGILVTQGISILINIFFGVALNAARGVVEHANGAINTFVSNFMTALNPQITKSYSAKDYEYMNDLMCRGAKFASILYWFFALGIFIESDEILQIWLVEVPPFASIFLRLTIICSIFQSLSHSLYIGMLATGNIKKYQIVMGIIYAGSFLLCYVFFAIGLGPEYGYVSTIIAYLIAVFVRLKLLSQMIPEFSAKFFFIQVFLKALVVVTTSTIIVIGFKLLVQIPNKYIEMMAVIIISLASVGILSYIFAFSNNERVVFKTHAIRLVKKMIKR
jgi:O-antigen/teichoic acid export membrane protein